MARFLLWPPDPARAIGISPRVDIVFRELFGTVGREAMLRDLLNEVLAWPTPIVEVAIVPDALLPEQLTHKGVIIDVRAVDAAGRSYQIEMQNAAQPAFFARAVYGLAGLVRSKLKRGDEYGDLRPSVALWFCDDDVLPLRRDDAGQVRHHRRVMLSDVQTGEVMTDLLELHVVELSRLRALRRGEPPRPEERWQRFLAEGETWNKAQLGELMTPTLESAMNVLLSYTEDDVKQRHYERQLEAERVERTRQAAMERAQRAQAESERALAIETAARQAEAERARQAETAAQEARQQVERLAALLRSLGQTIPE